MTGDTHPSTHPPLPPTTEDDRVAWLRLLRSRRVGTATFYRLLAAHETAQAALAALPGVARAAGVTDYSPCPPGAAEAEWQRGTAAGARMICITDASYPPALRDIADPPPFLWVMGDPAHLLRPCISMVGARNASSLGTRMAKALAAELSEAGFIVVSGLARGIDTAAHLAALERGTLAVMAGGVDIIYPAENTRLGEDVLTAGARLSEQPMGLIPQARHFPRRNRLIAGMSAAVVVVEAAARSGSLITARDAADQGRDVLAVPGHPFDGRAAGCNTLLRDGATLVRSAQDVIEAVRMQNPHVAAAVAPEALPQEPARLPLPDSDAPHRAAPQASAALQAAGPRDTPAQDHRSLSETAQLHRSILERLGPAPLAEDQLIRDLGAASHAIAPALVDLELEGHVQREPGGLLRRSDTGKTG